jgi:hypothetical protein
MASNSGREKAPTPKAVTVFKGIKGLVASGPGTKKISEVHKVRPEQNEGAKIPTPPTSSPSKGQAVTQKAASVPKPGGKVSVGPKINPEPAIRRDSASVVKPFKK